VNRHYMQYTLRCHEGKLHRYKYTLLQGYETDINKTIIEGTRGT